MATIEQNIARISQAKADIKAAIEAKGVTVDSAATIDAYADYVEDIPTGGGDENRLNTLLKNEITSLTASDLSGVTTIKAGTFRNTSIETLSLPSTITRINSAAFMSCHQLKNVSIPGVTFIGDTAFSDCTALEEIDLSSVSQIEASSFSNCQNLSSVTLSNSLQYLQPNVFQRSVFPALTIPSSVTSISNHVVAPGGAIKFESSTPPSINRYSFSNPTGMVFYVPPTAVDTYKNAGGYWSGLTNYIEPYPTGNTVYHYTSTDGKIVKPTNWYFRAWYLSNTYDETNKGELVFSGTPTNSGVFSGRTTLESITLPDSVTNVVYQCFYNCTSLNTISLPSGVTSIGDFCFTNCNSLKTLIISATTPPTLSNNPFPSTSLPYYIYVPAESVDAYKAATYWINVSSKIVPMPTGTTVFHYTSTDENTIANPSNIDAIFISNTYDETNKGELTFSGTPSNSGVFSGTTTLESIVIPEGITNINNSAFYNCTGMTSISLPNSLTGISYAAFSRCSALSDITIPSGVTSIDSAFVYCTGLRSFTSLATTPPTLSGNIFEYVTVNFPIYVPAESVEAYRTARGWSSYATHIFAIPLTDTSEIHYTTTDGNIVSPINPDYSPATLLSNTYGENGGVMVFQGVPDKSNMFNGTTTLESITFPSGMTQIDNYAFYNCNSLTSVTLSNTIYRIGNDAFNNCSSLSNINLSNGVTRINLEAFYNCTALTGVTFNEGLMEIGLRGFSNTGLRSIVIPNSTTLAGHCFENCSALTSATLSSATTVLNENMFANCTSLASITLPNSLTALNGGVFEGCTALQSITIPTGVTHFGYNEFAGCSGLTEAYILPITPPQMNNYSFAYAFINTTCPIYVPAESVDTYKAASGWSYIESRIQAIPTP